jgi:hypothetical protein
LDSTAVFNEIMYDPEGDPDQSLEYIELFNQLAVDIDLSEWRIEGGVDYTFPDGTTIPGRGYVVIAKTPVELESETGLTNVLGPFGGSLNNNGEELRLYNNDERLLNIVDYGDSGDWPAAADGSGASLAKANAFTHSALAENWTFSTEVGGTPGAQNFAVQGAPVVDTFVQDGDDWRLHVPADNSLAATWTANGFNDASWTVGATPIGSANPNANLETAGELFVNLSASDASAGSAVWSNAGTLGDFNRVGNPGIQVLDGVRAIAFNNNNTDGSYQSSINAPVGLTGVDPTRSIEVWAFNPAIGTEETLVAWGHRDGPNGTNMSFNYGSNATFGAVGHWGTPDLGWGTLPQANQWHHLVYTYDGTTTRVYDNGDLVNSSVLGAGVINTHTGTPITLAAQVRSNGSIDFGTREGNLALARVRVHDGVLTGNQILSNYNVELVEFGGSAFATDVTNLMNGGETIYARQDFNVDADVDYEVMTLRMQYDDGFVAYLNGTEVARSNAPAPAQWDSAATADRDDTLAPQFEVFDLTPHIGELVDGNNILSIHGLESTTSDNFFLMTAELDAPQSNDSTQLVINEVAAGALGVGEFWFEITNTGSRPVDISGYQVKTETGQYTIGAETLNSGEFLVIDEADFGFDVDNGDHVFLLNVAGDEVIDGRRVTASLRGLTDRYDGRWQYPDVGTPNGANTFSFNDDLVVNEIMYHFRENPVPFTESTEEWIELYNRGSNPVVLTGWKLDDAVRYDFLPNTTIEPDEYLLIARDPATLQTKYPALDIVGPFSGTLSNGDDRIQLEDAAGNLADEVHYYDGGSWEEYADGGGSSLELSDPFADNAKAEVWDASDESDKAVWTNYSYRGDADIALIGNTFNEFILGLLDSGEFLIDDVSVVLSPDGAATEMMQNGSFETDAVGTAPAAWRLIGNHVGTVVVDPADAGNQALHVTARGAQAHVHDHAETTFVSNTSLVNGGDYEMSFRLRWVAGNSQLNNRLYFNRASNTAILTVPENLGTPGAVNSNVVANSGPTYERLQHLPAVPLGDETVAVSVAAEDPDGLAQVDLVWRVNDDPWSAAAMTLGGDGLYKAFIPGQSSNDVVQFYVQGQDALGAVSTFPKEGEDSRAQFEVFDNIQTNNPVDTLRLVITPTDNSHLFSSQERMSNDTVGATLIVNNTDVYYNIRVRQTGSRFIRPNSGYKVALNPEQKFHGVHESIRLDMNGLKEIYMKQMVSRAGGSSVSMYDDISYIATPQHGGRAILLNLARYEDVFLEEQFLNGSDGTKWELDDITYPTNPQPSPEGLKVGTGVSAQDMSYRGEDPENYRGQLLIKNNRVKDDFQKIVDLTEALSNNGDDLYNAAEQVMDVDLWMRHYATQSWLGNWDTYGFRRPKNLRIYDRPSDGKIIPLFWDADLANLTEPFIYNGGVTRLDELRNIPHVERLFWGHMWDLMNRSFNIDYISPWITEFQSLGQNFSGEINKVINRTNDGRSQAINEIVEVPFVFTTNGGNEVTVDTDTATLQGTGWINVREIHFDDNALEVTWIDEDTWEVTVPVPAGTNEITFEAFDFEGNPACDDNSACVDSTATITVTSTVVDRPLQDFLRITEVMYNPIDPTATEIVAGFDKSDDFEYIEFHNISPTETLDLSGATFVAGVTYTFPANTMLGPDQFLLVVEDIAAMTERYGNGLNIDGQWSGGLSSTGERITVVDTNNAVIADFTYSDSGDWPGRADGNGSSLTPIGNTVNYSNPDSWESSADYSGSPGVANTPTMRDIVINEVLSHTDIPQLDSVELFNPTGQDIEITGWYLSDSNNNYRKYQFPDPTTILANSYLVVDESAFNPTPLTPGLNDFGLNGAHGDNVYLVEADAQDDLIRFADSVEFGAQANGESWGRFPNGTGDLYPMETLTLDLVNSGPRVGPIVISEVMYNPADPDGVGGIDTANLEFIEVHNPTLVDEDLTNWEIDKGIDFAFPANTMLLAGNTLVIVGFDPAVGANATLLSDFRNYYGIDETVTVLGGFSGRLDNDGERVRLLRADAPPLDEPDFYPLLLEDEVRFFDTAPWPEAADEGELSLTRRSLDQWGNDPLSWGAVPPTPGNVYVGPARVLSVDINALQVDPADLAGKGPQPTSWQQQRSALTDIQIEFTDLVDVEIADFVLTNLGVNSPVDADQVVSLAANHLSVELNVVTLTFDAYELPDGVYRLEILPTATNIDGQPIDGDGDGTEGDAYVLEGNATNLFYQLAAEWSGDEGVSVFDFSTFSYWFGQTVGVAPLYADASGDGGISVFDFTAFSVNFGKSVVFPNAFAAIAAPPTQRAVEDEEGLVDQAIERIALDDSWALDRRLEEDSLRLGQRDEVETVDELFADDSFAEDVLVREFM